MLVRKMLREIKSNLSQFISIFILVIMGTLVFTGLNSLGVGMDQSSKQYYENTNLADAFFRGNGFSSEQIEELRNQNGVEGVEPRYQINCSLREDSNVVLQMNYVTDNTISSFHLVEGEEYSNDSSGIWLDSEFAKENDLEIGNSITYVMAGTVMEQKIVGLIMHPEYLYCVKDDKQAIPDHKNYGYGVASDKVRSDHTYNQLLIDTAMDKREIEASIAATSLRQRGVLIMKKDHQSVAMFQNEINQMSQLQIVFPAAFLVIAFLTIITTMTRITSNQRPQIGILKALGFSNHKIIIHYMSYGFFVSLFGSIIGVVVGIVNMAPACFTMEKAMYTMPSWFIRPQWYVYFIIVSCVVACGLCSYIAARKELVGTAASILRPRIGMNQNHMPLEKLTWWKKRKFDTQWNMRDCFRNKLRSFIAVFGVMGAVMLIECGLGLSDTLSDMVDYSYERINTYEKKIELSASITEEEIADLSKNSQVQLVQENAIEVYRKGEEGNVLTSSMTVFEEGEYLHCLDANNEAREYKTDGITITNRIAEVLHLKKNDSIIFKIYGTDSLIEGKVVDIVLSPIGQSIFIPKSVYENFGVVFTPNIMLLGDTSISMPVHTYESIQTKEDLKEGLNDILTMMNTIIVILIGAAVILGVVVLYNLGVISFYERVRELATLKVLGFQYKRLQRLLQLQNIWLSTVGCIIGIPAGKLMLQVLMLSMGDSFDMPAVIHVSSYVLSVAGTFLLSLIITRLLSWKLKNIDMVSALKSVE